MLAAAAANPDRGRILSLVRGVDATDLVESAKKHRMVSLVYQRLKDIDGVPRSSLDALATARHDAQARRVVLLRLLVLMKNAIEVPALSIKGHALAANWYAEPSTRDFNDLDVLVRPSDFAPALDSLAAAGMAPASSNWHGFLDHQVAEIPVRFRTAVIDLHWHVVALGCERRYLRLPTEAFFERAPTARFGNLDVLTLDPADTLLHLCVNTGLGGARQLRGLIDIDTVVRSGKVDLSEFAVRVQNAGAGRLSAAILQRANLLLGTPVDPVLLGKISADRAWLAMNRWMDRSSSRRHSSDNVASGVLLSSGRSTRRASTASLLRAAGRAVGARMGRVDLTDPGGALDWNLRPLDTHLDGHRGDYLAWVGAQTDDRGDRSR